MAQAGSLMAAETRRDVGAGLAACVAIGWLDDAAGDALAGAYALCWCVLQASRLLSDAPLDPGALGEGARAFLLRETGADTLADAERKLAEATERAAGVIDAALGAAGKGDEA